jgi:DNA invertase Pin-like site-specific DNA recombinase
MGFADEIEGEHGKKGKGRRKPANTGPVVDLDTLTDEQIVGICFCIKVTFSRKKWKEIKERRKSKRRKREKNGIWLKLIPICTSKVSAFEALL